MKSFHPLTILIFFAAMTAPLMLVNSFALAAVACVGAVIILLSVRCRTGLVRELMGYLMIFIAMSVLNPLFVHRGSTPLFFLNGRAVTLEALLYGINSSLRLTAVLIWCRSFSLVMTSDRVFCLTGKLSPKISAMLTMAVRFIPDMLAQGRKISAYSRTSGKFHDDSFTGRLRRLMSVFSALVTWSIESGVQTADSMKARGFELSGRTAYSRFSFSAEDIVLILLSGASCAVSFFLSSKLNTEFYPKMIFSHETAAEAVSGAFTAAAYLFPAIFGFCIRCRRGRRGKLQNEST